jgi:hypothetical protein
MPQVQRETSHNADNGEQETESKPCPLALVFSFGPGLVDRPVILFALLNPAAVAALIET